MASVTLWLNEIVNVIHILEVRRPIAPMKKPPLFLTVISIPPPHFSSIYSYQRVLWVRAEIQSSEPYTRTERKVCSILIIICRYELMKMYVGYYSGNW